jgi:peptidase E
VTAPRAISRTDRRRIFAMGGGGFAAAPGDPALDRYVLDIAPAVTPRICLLPTASGDPDEQIQRFYRAFHELPCEPSHLSLFRLGSQPVDLRARLLEQDVIYVGGGSMLNMLAIWRVHGLDEVLHEAWHRGIVLAGISAGSMCWFTWGVTKSSGAAGPARGLGLLPASNSVHWRSEPERRPAFRSAVAAGHVPAGYGVDDGAGLLFAGTEMVEAVTARPGGGAWRVEECAAHAIELPVHAIELAPVEREVERNLAIAEFREASRRRPAREHARAGRHGPRAEG